MKTAAIVLLCAASCAAGEVWDVSTGRLDFERVVLGRKVADFSTAGDCVTFQTSELQPGEQTGASTVGLTPIDIGVFRVTGTDNVKAAMTTVNLFGLDERGFDIRQDVYRDEPGSLSHSWDVAFDALGKNNTYISVAAHGRPATATITMCFPPQGDATIDGMVNAADLNTLAINWQQDGSWESGDFNASGFVDAADLNLLAMNWHSPPAAAAVPEPTSLLHLLALFALPIRNRYSRSLASSNRT